MRWVALEEHLAPHAGHGRLVRGSIPDDFSGESIDVICDSLYQLGCRRISRLPEIRTTTNITHSHAGSDRDDRDDRASRFGNSANVPHTHVLQLASPRMAESQKCRPYDITVSRIDRI